MPWHLVVALGFALLAGAPAARATAFFTGLGTLPGATSSSAAAVSADGSAVVGNSGADVYRWTAQGGMTSLAKPPDVTSIGVSDVSADGSVVVGTLNPPGPGQVQASEPYRWTAADGVVPLGFPGRGNGVSADGGVVVGRLPSDDEHDNNEAFRWTQNEGLVRLGFSDNVFSSLAIDVSGDGSLILGDRALESDVEVAILWTAPGVARGIDLPGGETASRAGAISENGVFVVGLGASEDTEGVCEECVDDAFLYRTDDHTYLRLGVFGIPHAVSDTGVVLQGSSVWDAVRGWRPVQEFLSEQGVDFTGWMISGASGISADGRTLVGTGTNPDGATEAWIAFLPEPGTAGLLALGLAGLTARGRRQGRKVVASWRSSQ